MEVDISKKTTLIPVNWENRHWILLEVDGLIVNVYDSLPGTKDMISSKNENFKASIEVMCPGKSFTIVNKTVPEQSDLASCGVHVCFHAMRIAMNSTKVTAITQASIDRFRMRIAEIFTSFI